MTTSALGVATAPLFTANGSTGTFIVTATACALHQNFWLTNSAVAVPPPSGQTVGAPVMTLAWLLLTVAAFAWSGTYLIRRGQASR